MTKLRDWEREVMEVEALLNGLGDIAQGDTLYQRVMSVLNYYIAQMARWPSQVDTEKKKNIYWEHKDTGPW